MTAEHQVVSAERREEVKAIWSGLRVWADEHGLFDLQDNDPTFWSFIAALDAQHAQRTSAEIEALWQDILDKDDRTSPAEYPDMALITFEEFASAIEGTGQ